MAIWAGHRHLLFARFLVRDLAVALTPHGIVGVCSHLAALGTLRAPIPLADFYVQLFGRHLNLLASRGVIADLIADAAAIAYEQDVAENGMFLSWPRRDELHRLLTVRTNGRAGGSLR